MPTHRHLRKALASFVAIGWMLAAVAGATAAPTPREPDWTSQGEVFYLIFVRSFADSNDDHVGDFKGIEQRLGYLQDLGVTSLLLTPIVPSVSYHNYFATRFDGVDAAYGDLASFRHLVKALHARHMKIYLDQEIQYVQEGHPWWVESAGHPESRYGQYVLYNGPANTQPEAGFLENSPSTSYDGRPAQIAMVNLHNPAVQRYFADLFVWWADPHGTRRFEEGVDGFRIDHMMDDLDARGKLKDLVAGFWAPLFAQVRAVNPRTSIIAEQADWGFGDDLLRRGGVDLVYAFPLRAAIASFDRDAVANAIAHTAAKTPPGKGQLIFIENHDTDRFASVVGADARKERLGAALTILLKGSPLIYYGQELGMKGRQNKAGVSDANDIPVREAFRWTHRVEDPGSAIWYRGTDSWWTGRYARDDDGISVEEERNDPKSLLAFYRRLLALRRARADLREGDQRIVATDQSNVLAVQRARGHSASLLVANFSAAEVSARIPASSLPGAKASAAPADLLTNTRSASIDGTDIVVELPPFAVQLLAAR